MKKLRMFALIFLFAVISGFLAILPGSTFASDNLSWPETANSSVVIGNREFNGAVKNCTVESSVDLAWEFPAQNSPAKLHIRIKGRVSELASGYSSGRVGFLSGLFRLGLPDGVNVNQATCELRVFDGSQWIPLQNRKLSKEEDAYFSSKIGRDLLTRGMAGVDGLMITKTYAQTISSDILIVEPSGSFSKSTDGNSLSSFDLYWLEPSDKNGNPLINRKNPGGSLVDTLAIEIVIPFDSLEAKECNFYIGYVECVNLARSRRGTNESIYNYRTWEGRIALAGNTQSKGETDSETEPTKNKLKKSDLTNKENLTPADTIVPPKGMVYIPAGTYFVGASPMDREAKSDEKPGYEVIISGFFIDIYPVTNDQYWEFVAETRYRSESIWDLYYQPGQESHPVRGVSYYDAVEYAKWAGKRLPTEAEWEIAARGNDQRIYPWGNDWNGSYVALTNFTSVKAHPENISPFGVREMVGNVWEWTSSSYAPYPGSTANCKPSFNVLKGGSVRCTPPMCRISERGADPAFAVIGSYGFRCVMDLPSNVQTGTAIGSEKETQSVTEDLIKKDDSVEDNNTSGNESYF